MLSASLVTLPSGPKRLGKRDSRLVVFRQPLFMSYDELAFEQMDSSEAQDGLFAFWHRTAKKFRDCCAQTGVQTLVEVDSGHCTGTNDICAK